MPNLIYFLYHIVNLLLLPFYFILLIYRLYKNKEVKGHILERFATPSQKRNKNDYIIWLHAASIGESLIALTLIDAINTAILKLGLSNAQFLITTTTKSSSEVLKHKLAKNAIHQFIPIDNIIFVRRFLNYWKPSLGIFIESELWPVIISQSSKVCPLVLLNARLSDKSFARWQSYNFLFRIIVAHFNQVVVQSVKDLKKFQSLGIKNALNLGNIKFANKKLTFDLKKAEALTSVLKDYKVILFASTHLADERIILEVIKPLKKTFPYIFFILALRHPERIKEVEQACKVMDISFSVRTQREVPALEKDLYIVDTFNELGLFYNLSYITFVGGSFASGGHNPLEPAHFGNIIIFGPDMTNCYDISIEMLTKKSAIQIQDADSLKKELKYFLDSKNYESAAQYSKNAVEFVSSKVRVVEDYIEVIKPYLPRD